MQSNLVKHLIIQAFIGAVVLTVFMFYGYAKDSLYGVMIGLANMLMLGLTFEFANNKAKEDPKTGILVLYVSAAVRFILLAVLFIIGLALFRLEAMPMVITFVVMTIGQMFNLKGKRRLMD